MAKRYLDVQVKRGSKIVKVMVMADVDKKEEMQESHDYLKQNHKEFEDWAGSHMISLAHGVNHLFSNIIEAGFTMRIVKHKPLEVKDGKKKREDSK